MRCGQIGGGWSVTRTRHLSDGTDVVIEVDAFSNEGFKAEVILESD